ncbi:MAG: alanine:cation symporter family protein [Clostridia bacterium]|nr:alanine:cation symporter family protein [Clostridia bacterium]
MEVLEKAVAFIGDNVSLLLTVMIFAVGIFMTVKFRFGQARHLGKGMKYLFSEEDGAKGDVSSFGAFCTALSATIGTGNIVGVATAICAGGPGALFWMLIAAIFGMATKYAECLLAVKYRRVDASGNYIGGPFLYIEDGLGKRWKWLAVFFAACGALCCLLGVGSFSQINSMSSALNRIIPSDVAFMIGETPVTWTVVIGGFVLSTVIAIVLLGGLKSISKLSEILVPFMAIIYVVLCLIVLGANIAFVPEAFRQIVVGAFNPQAVTGGAVGTFIIAMQKGVARGIFSNEAGLGSAPIAAAAAKTNSAVRQGLIGMTGVFFDTIIICTLTGLTVIITGVWNVGLEGFDVTATAFSRAIPFLPSGLVEGALSVCLLIFAFTTILGWNYYGDRCVAYITKDNKKWLKAFRIIHICLIFIGPYLTVSLVWNIADVLNSFMAFPNIIAILALSGVVVKETRNYFKKQKEEKTNTQTK